MRSNHVDSVITHARPALRSLFKTVFGALVDTEKMSRQMLIRATSSLSAINIPMELTLNLITSGVADSLAMPYWVAEVR